MTTPAQPASPPAAAFQPAVDTLRRFIDAGLRNDQDAMKACLSKKTLESGQFSGDSPQGVTFTLGEPTADGDAVVIPMTAAPPPSPDAPADAPPPPPAMSMQCVMIREDGEWKFDLATTMDRMMAPLMDQMTSAVGAMAEGIGQAFSEGLTAAFGEGEPEEAPDWSGVIMARTQDECYPMPVMTPLPKLTEALTAAVGAPVQAEAAMDDLLRQVASDQKQTLIDWFEETLFANWGSLLADVAATMPLAGRLRAVRIESAAHTEHRFIALDGNDLVYRLYLNDDTNGFYSDAELQTLLPGVLAGLPEEISHDGYRLLPADDEYPDLDVYKKWIAPRCMKRISDLVGRPVAWKHDLDSVHDPATAARELPRWGLNRVLGAIALACMDDIYRQDLSTNLKAVSLKLSGIINGKYALYEDGVLELGIQEFNGENGCFYEHELLPVFGGEAINPDGREGGYETATASDDPQCEDARMSTDAESDDDEDADGGEASAEEDQARAAQEAAEAAQRNAENFRGAVEHLRSVEDAWRQQLEFALGHPAALHLDYDALNGNYDLVQPFIHQALSGALGAISMVGFDPAWKPKIAVAQQIVITLPPAGEETSATMDGETLVVRVKLGPEGPPPVAAVAAAIKAALGGDGVPAAPAQAAADPWSPAPPPADPYATADEFMTRLEAALREVELWPGEKPPGPLEVKGAFGSGNMAFEQWLAWVLVPRVRQIVAERGDFPNGSAVATYARRALDGVPGADRVVDVLYEFDTFVDRLAGG